MSIDDLRDVYQIHKPDYIYTMITETFTRQPIAKYLDQLSCHFKESKILVSGYQVVAQKIITNSNTIVLKNLQETVDFLELEKSVSSRSH